MASRFAVIEEITTDNIAEMTSLTNKAISGVHTEMETIKKIQENVDTQIKELTAKQQAS